jgi:hypothetical protein
VQLISQVHANIFKNIPLPHVSGPVGLSLGRTSDGVVWNVYIILLGQLRVCCGGGLTRPGTCESEMLLNILLWPCDINCICWVIMKISDHNARCGNCVCVSVCVCACVCVRVCVRACVCVCVRKRIRVVLVPDAKAYGARGTMVPLILNPGSGWMRGVSFMLRLF